MARPLLLDLFCGAGGAAAGYHRAGFDVVGVDIKPQPHYPYPFIQADALKPPLDLGAFDVVHASPPCQHYANVTRWRGSPENHPALIEPTRTLLRAWGGRYVMENVRTYALRSPSVLCGSTFGLGVRRHRYFETNWMPYELMPACNHSGLLPFMHKGERAYADAMGCNWMNKTEAREAIPPAYTEYIGSMLLEHLKRAA